MSSKIHHTILQEQSRWFGEAGTGQILNAHQKKLPIFEITDLV
jgi:hypothetical protein